MATMMATDYALEDGFGHRFCGVLLRVVTGGSIALADAAELHDRPLPDPFAALLVLDLAIIWAVLSPDMTAQTASAKTLTGQDLVQTSVDALVDPFEHLSDDQFFDLQTLPPCRPCDCGGARGTHLEGAEIVKRMTATGFAPFALLDRFMAFVAEIKEVNAQTVGALDGQLVRLPGFVLTLTDNGPAGERFLLAHCVGACIHTRRRRPIKWFRMGFGGYKTENLFEPVWVTGRLTATATRRFIS